MDPSESVPTRARELLHRFDDPGERDNCADDLLMFLYRLRDRAEIVESRSTVVRGKSFHPLGALIYDLESRPDETMNNEHQCRIIRTLLYDLATGTILVTMPQ